MEYITTFTEEHFYPLRPEADKLNIVDIAHSLSMLCRGNGHTKTFFSVAQHCLFCAREAKARGLSKRIILACLIHDASEAYMSDVPRPLKKELRAYIRAEENLLHIIYEKYLGSDLTPEEEKIVKEIDDEMLYYDLKILLNEPLLTVPPLVHIDLDYSVRNFIEVESEYIDFFESLTEEEDEA